MSTSAQDSGKTPDTIQERLVDYASSLTFNQIPPEVVHAAKIRIIDTIGASVAGFLSEPCRIARELASSAPASGATVIGTRTTATPDMAAFVNAITARDAEMMDFYHWPGSFYGHPSDTTMAVLACAEHARVSGREFLTGIVIAYEVFCRIANGFRNRGFDTSNFACLGAAAAAGRMLGLTRVQLGHCIAIAATSSNMLHQVRIGHLSMFKVGASGVAARAAVFSALLARAGMEGPHLPFEGKAGWCDHVAANRFTLDNFTAGHGPYKILDTSLKRRPAAAPTIAPILAAEKIAPIGDVTSIEHVTVEVYKWAKDTMGSGAHLWNPESRETADHSIPYVVAAALIDGTITQKSFDDAHLWNPPLRALLQKTEVIENPEFTEAFGKIPVQHRVRVSVVMANGQRLVGETTGAREDEEMSDAEVDQKFRTLSEDLLGSKRTTVLLRHLWRLDEMDDISALPPLVTIA